ncbi:Predicted endonuclease distantly related to archaeal Holliday junction resolvase [hydrothermal vent metagenome]|uniref:Predicted endonuclease distantly related to archaeal Holliday junction resolvase n=1 Tax=hydrothermal vent metagenome TaxID=652676 RepID=A0A3B0Y7J2_9ZZZZ
MKKSERGHCAEQIALTFLQQNRFSLLHQNYYCRFGEIDIIAQQQQLIIFVEVRYRKNNWYGNAVESVTKVKQDKITLTARYYIHEQLPDNQNFDFRFDVIALSSLNINKKLPDWIQGAW